jgi:hypothetical protein
MGSKPGYTEEIYEARESLNAIVSSFKNNSYKEVFLKQSAISEIQQGTRKGSQTCIQRCVGKDI